MSGSAVVGKVASPYSRLAANYDSTLGLRFFAQTRSTFEKLVRLYGISFRAAADIGCGTGLFAKHLRLSRRIPIFAVDLSEPMLRVAARNCCGTDVMLIRQDIRRLRLPRKVDLITANFDTLNHILTQEDLVMTMKKVAANLNAGGHFIFDLVTNCPPLNRGVRVRHFGANARRVTQRISFDPLRKLLSILVAITSPDSREPVIERHCERFYSVPELGHALRAAGFMILGVHDPVTLAFASGCPPRIVVVSRKKG